MATLTTKRIFLDVPARILILDTMVIMYTTHTHTYTTVSYTHLDVYKRQPENVFTSMFHKEMEVR